MIALNDVHHFFKVVLLLASTILMVIHYVYIKIKVKSNDAINKFLLAHLMLIFWGAFLLLQHIVPGYANKTVITYFEMLSITLVGYNILIFAYSYSYKKSISDKKSMLFIAVPLACFLIYNVGVFVDEPIGFNYSFVTAIILISYFIVGIMFFAYYTIKTKGLNRTKQCAYFSAAIGFDIYAYVIFCFESKGIDTTRFIYIMPVYLLFLIAFTMKYQLYDKMPFVLEAVLQNGNQGIIVINNYLKVVDYNKNFFKNYINIDEIEVLEDFIERLKTISTNKLSVDNVLYAVKSVEQNHFTGDLKILNNDIELFLSYTVNSIYDDHELKVATMITFRDITEMTCLQNGIRNKNSQLLRANNKLEEHMKNVQDLTVEKERDVLMTEINDTFGHSMTEIMALLEVCALLLEHDENNEAIEKAIEETTTRARAALAQMRDSVSRYKKEVAIND